jgi:hypothetical protein
MKRLEQAKHNQLVIDNITRTVGYSYRIPSYRAICRILEHHGILSSVGNKWTERSVYRLLQRNGYSGLWGLHKFMLDK